MKTYLKYIAVAALTLGVSGTLDTGAHALSKNQEKQRKAQLQNVISALIAATERKIDAIDAVLADNDDMPSSEERSLLQERRMLFTEYRRLKTRRDRMKTWSRFQVNYWASIYKAPAVSEA